MFSLSQKEFDDKLKMYKEKQPAPLYSKFPERLQRSEIMEKRESSKLFQPLLYPQVHIQQTPSKQTPFKDRHIMSWT